MPNFREGEKVDKPSSTIKRARRPLGTPRLKLPVPVWTDFVGRVINDIPGRIESALAGGYEFVEAKDAPGWGNAIEDGNTDLGTKVSRVVGTNSDGTAMRGYLMRIPKEWYDADQAEKMQKVDAVDDAIKHGTHDEKPSDKRYIKNIDIR